MITQFSSLYDELKGELLFIEERMLEVEADTPDCREAEAQMRTDFKLIERDHEIKNLKAYIFEQATFIERLKEQVRRPAR
jgi:hypothetical protein